MPADLPDEVGLRQSPSQILFTALLAELPVAKSRYFRSRDFHDNDAEHQQHSLQRERRAHSATVASTEPGNRSLGVPCACWRAGVARGYENSRRIRSIHEQLIRQAIAGTLTIMKMDIAATARGIADLRWKMLFSPARLDRFDRCHACELSNCRRIDCAIEFQTAIMHLPLVSTTTHQRYRDHTSKRCLSAVVFHPARQPTARACAAWRGLRLSGAVPDSPSGASTLEPAAEGAVSLLITFQVFERWRLFASSRCR